MWYKNIAGRFFGLVTKHACDRRTDGQDYDSQDRASIAASRGKNEINTLAVRFLCFCAWHHTILVLSSDVWSKCAQMSAQNYKRCIPSCWGCIRQIALLASRCRHQWKTWWFCCNRQRRHSHLTHCTTITQHITTIQTAVAAPTGDSNKVVSHSYTWRLVPDKNFNRFFLL